MGTLGWTSFFLFVLVMLALDLGIFHKTSHEVRFKESLIWTFVWITLALLFNIGVYYEKGPHAGMQFLAGYLIELSLSIDNLFVFLLIFRYFQVPRKFEHKILLWGVLGAILMRAIFILGGIVLVSKFHWLMYVFGLFLMFTGSKLLFENEKKVDPEKNPVLRLARKVIPFTSEVDERGSLFLRRHGKLCATPLLVVILVVETTDVLFAVDSIPAIFGVTLNPFIVYTSNVFAILGLRSLYFALSGAMETFHRLSMGLSFILIFIGLKMLIVNYFPIPIGIALGVIVFILVASIVASIVWPANRPS